MVISTLLLQGMLIKLLFHNLFITNTLSIIFFFITGTIMKFIKIQQWAAEEKHMTTFT